MASQTFRLAVFVFMTLELIFGILYKYIILNHSSTFLILENVTLGNIIVKKYSHIRASIFHKSVGMDKCQHPTQFRFDIWPVLPDRFGTSSSHAACAGFKRWHRLSVGLRSGVCLFDFSVHWFSKTRFEAGKVLLLCMHFKNFQPFFKWYSDTEVDQHGSSQSRRAPVGAAVCLKGSSDPSLRRPRLVTLGQSGFCMGVHLQGHLVVSDDLLTNPLWH